MATDTHPNWVPDDLTPLLDLLDGFDWWGKDYPGECLMARRLASDERMREVWEWHERIRENQLLGKEWRSMDFVLLVRQATRMPEKPYSMPPKQRLPYLESVRHHAEALVNLLSDTQYESAPQSARYTRAPSPSNSGLVKNLREVSDRARQYEFREQEGMLSRSPIRRTGPGARVVNFNCKLYEAFARREIEIPFPILATVANVALELPADQQTDEDTARKQVRRHLDRVGYPEVWPAYLNEADFPYL